MKLLSDLSVPDPSPTERVGEFTYRLWKFSEPLPAEIPRFSKGFLGLALFGSLAFVVLGRGIAERIQQGDLTSFGLFTGGLLVSLFGSLIVVGLALRRRPRVKGVAQPPPEGIPRDAIAAEARVDYRGRSAGWLWFEHDWLIFQGTAFDFRLRRQDFVMKGSKALWRDEGALLKRPPGIASHRLRLVLGSSIEGTFVPEPRKRKEIEAALASWESGTPTDEPSLFPPVRPAPTEKPSLTWMQWIAPPALVAFLLGGSSAILPPTGNSPPIFIGIGLLIGLTWPLALFLPTRIAESLDREVDRAIQSGEGDRSGVH